MYIKSERKKLVLKKQEKIMKYLLNKENPYKLKVEGMIVEITYSKNNKKFEECMLNIIRQKIKQM